MCLANLQIGVGVVLSDLAGDLSWNKGDIGRWTEMVRRVFRPEGIATNGVTIGFQFVVFQKVQANRCGNPLRLRGERDFRQVKHTMTDHM